MNDNVLLTAIFSLIIMSITFILLGQEVLAQGQNQNSSGSFSGITAVDMVQIIAGIATAGAVVYAGLTFRHSRQYSQITMSINFLEDLLNFQREIVKLISQAREKGMDPQEDNELKRSIYQYLSTVEWFCFFVKTKDIKDKRIISLFWPIIKSAIVWYNIYFPGLSRKDLNQNMFSNLKTLYSELEKDETMQRIHFEPFEILNELK
jgi:hypothetical protein